VPFCKEIPKIVADYLVHPNDIFISRAGSVGVSVLIKDAPYKSVFASYLIRIRPYKKIDSKYLSLFLQSPHYWNQVTELSSGIALANINATKIQSINLPLPPLPEQHKIVEILEDHLSRLDAALADVKQAKLKAAQFRRSLLQAAFTGNLTGDGTRLMTEWKKCKLSDVVELLSGFAFKSSDWQEVGVPVLKITNVRNGKVTLEGCSYISKQRAEESMNFRVNKGDLLITLTGEIGATGFYQEDFEARLNQRVGKIIPRRSEDVDLKFVAYFLESPQTRETMWSTAKGIAQANISPKEVLALNIPIPPLPEQQQIVEILEDHLSRLDASVSIADAMEKQSASLRRSLLQAAFTGELTKEVASV